MCYAGFVWGGETQKATSEVRRAEGSEGMLGKGGKVERIAEKEMMYGCRERRMESRGERRRGLRRNTGKDRGM